jgi:hypothetical protein
VIVASVPWEPASPTGRKAAELAASASGGRNPRHRQAEQPTLGHGAAAFDVPQRRLNWIAAETHTHVDRVPDGALRPRSATFDAKNSPLSAATTAERIGSRRAASTRLWQRRGTAR